MFFWVFIDYFVSIGGRESRVSSNSKTREKARFSLIDAADDSVEREQIFTREMLCAGRGGGEVG